MIGANLVDHLIPEVIKTHNLIGL